MRVTCPCGTTFDAKPCRVTSGEVKFCSRACYHLSRRTSGRVKATCPCGTGFETTENLIASGRGKFCSGTCRYRNATRRSGLTYDIHTINNGWFPSKPESEHQTPEEKAAYKQEWKRRNPDKVKAQQDRDRAKRPKADPGETYRRWLWRCHGMTPEDHEAMVVAQGSLCYLCGDILKFEREGRARQAYIDHDHRCCPAQRSCASCRRGLACPGCNYIIGFARDDPERLMRIASNLKKALFLLDLEG